MQIRTNAQRVRRRGRTFALVLELLGLCYPLHPSHLPRQVGIGCHFRRIPQAPRLLVSAVT